MRIGYEASRANQPQKTGTEWYAHDLIRALLAIDHENEYILYSRTPLEPSLANLGPNVQSEVLPWPPRLWTHTALLWEVNTHRPDVLYVPSHTIPILHPPRTVTMVHDVGFRRSPELYAPHELAYHRFSMWLAAKTARLLLVPSEFTKQEILDLYHIDPKKIAVIHHGFDAGIFRVINDRSEVDRLCMKHGFRAPFLFYIGRLQEKKNIPNLIRAFALVHNAYPDVQLVLAGNPDFHFDRMRELIHTLRLDEVIKLPGFLPRADIPAVMNGAVAFVFPSAYEGFGFPVLEAQACGTPVVTSNAASLPEVGGEGALYADPKSPEAIAENIIKLLNDEGLRTAMRQKGHVNLLRFSYDQCARQTLAAIQSLV